MGIDHSSTLDNHSMALGIVFIVVGGNTSRDATDNLVRQTQAVLLFSALICI